MADQKKATGSTASDSGCKGCPCNTLLKWECPAKSATVFAVGNFFLLAVWLDFPLVAYLVSYGGFILLALGLALKTSKMVDPETLSMEQLFSKDQAVALTSSLYGVFLSLANVALPVVFWQNVQTNFIVVFVLYFFSGIMGMVSITFLCLAAFNMAFLYGKLEKEINAVAGPHIAQARTLLTQYWSKIPRYEKKQD